MSLPFQSRLEDLLLDKAWAVFNTILSEPQEVSCDGPFDISCVFKGYVPDVLHLTQQAECCGYVLLSHPDHPVAT